MPRSKLVFMINPADLKRMLMRAQSASQSADDPDTIVRDTIPEDTTPKTLETVENQGSKLTESVSTSVVTDELQSSVQTSTSVSSPASSRAIPSPLHVAQMYAESRRDYSMTYSSHYASGYFMDDEEYRVEYDLELDTHYTTNQFSSISSSIVPLYSTQTHSHSTTSASFLAQYSAGLFVSSSGTDDDSLPETNRTSEQFETTKKSQNTKHDDDTTTSLSSNFPTPAIMAKRQEDSLRSFASMDLRDLPVVREYSAGGLVFDEEGRVAIIARHSRSGHLEWCLPKGHIENGETPDQTAVREIHEETGILGEVIDSIAIIDYWFTGDAQRIHKLVHHYALKKVGGHLTVEGDPDHEAEDAIWVKFDDLTDILSYPNERRIVWLYAKKHKKDKA